MLTWCYELAVTGGIGGVGGYINGYGDTIKRSMSADGPASSSEKKTAVKPSTPVGAQKALPSTGGAKKALPPAGGAPKGLPAPSYKSTSTPKPAAQVSKPTAGGLQKPQSTVGAAKPGSKSATGGKVSISAASRPKPTAGTKTTASSAKKP